MRKKVFDKIQQPFMINTLSKLGKEGNFLSLIKKHLQKPGVSIILNDKKLEVFLLRSGTRQG